MVEYRFQLRPGDTRPHPLWDEIPDELALRVGRLMAAYSLIEFELEVIIWHLNGAISNHDRHCLTSRLNAQQKADEIAELLHNHYVPPEQQEAWKATKPALKKLAKWRDWLAHGVWISTLFRTYVQRTRAGKPPASIARVKPITDTDLDDWIAIAAQVLEHLNKLKLLPAGTMAAPNP